MKLIAKHIGEYFPFILVFVALIWVPHVFLLLGVVFNMLVIIMLKIIIKQKRPIPKLHLDYGMPSGHSQMATFVTTLIHFYNFRLFIISSLFCCVTFWQRIHFQHHFPHQVFVGGILGIIMALLYRRLYILLNHF
jgi:membrane-associated phospholipid phosphatase